MRIKRYVCISAVSVLLIILTSKVSAQAKSKTSQQIKMLIKEKNARTAVQKKIDSQLLQAIREKQGKKMTDSVDLQPANVNADAKGNLKVDIDANVTDTLLAKIKALGGIIIYPSKQYRTIRAEVNLSMVEKIAAFNEVKFIKPAAVAQLNNPVRPANRLHLQGSDIPIISPAAKTNDSGRITIP